MKIQVFAVGILTLFIGVIFVPCFSASSPDEDSIVNITRPENGYIYVFDRKTIPYGYPFVSTPKSNGSKSAYTYGLAKITVDVEVNSEVAVDHVVFSVMERKLHDRVFIGEYKDHEAPYQFIFSRTTLFPYRNYDIYVNAVDAEDNVLGSDSLGLGCYRAFYAKALFFTYLISNFL